MTMAVTLPWPPKLLSPNARAHWSQLSRAKKAYRSACATLALHAGLGQALPGTVAALRVHLVFYPPCRRQRDQDNMLASMKSGLDGLADALQVNDRLFRVSFEVADQIGGMVKVEIMEVPACK